MRSGSMSQNMPRGTMELLGTCALMAVASDRSKEAE
jgi:hypothetical protein